MNILSVEQEFKEAFSYEQYLRTGTQEQQRRWSQVYEVARLTDSQRQLIGQFTRQMNVLIISGIWCGDCVQQCPLLERIAQANPDRIAVRLVDRDLHKRLSEQLRINGGDRVPMVLFLSEDFEVCSVYGDRTLSRYRALAVRQLGAACEIALAPPDQDELAATMQDWIDEFERIQLMLRISPRLRKKHGD